jgi:hypothetical protein
MSVVAGDVQGSGPALGAADEQCSGVRPERHSGVRRRQHDEGGVLALAERSNVFVSLRKRLRVVLFGPQRDGSRRPLLRQRRRFKW